MSSVYDFLLGLGRDAFNSIRGWSAPKKLAVCVLFLLFLVVTFTVEVPDFVALQTWARSLGWLFPLCFTGLYVLIVQFPIPRTVLTLSSGLLFGPLLGSIIALTATTLGAGISLSIVRHFLGAWMRPRLRHPAVAGVTARMQQRGWLSITCLRMIAAVPFSILNYVAALSPVPLATFMLATLLGSAPGTIATVYFGDALATGTNNTLIIIAGVLASLGFLGLVLDVKLGVRTSV